MPADIKGSKTGCFCKINVCVLLVATIDPPYPAESVTDAVISSSVEKSPEDAASVHKPMPLVESGNPHTLLCDDDDSAICNEIDIVRPLVKTRVRPTASCTWKAARTLLES